MAAIALLSRQSLDTGPAKGIYQVRQSTAGEKLNAK
jgi:hypothetical protein